jgi:hypothetical protein
MSSTPYSPVGPLGFPLSDKRADYQQRACKWTWPSCTCLIPGATVPFLLNSLSRLS